MTTVAEQKELIKVALKNGIKMYINAINEKVGEYDREEVTRVLSMKTFEEMWEAYAYNDTMVRDYIIAIIIDEQNSFKADYEADKANAKAYKQAKEEGDEEGQKAAREAHNALMDAIGAKGKAYCNLYSEYEDSRDCGNELLDLHNTIWDDEVESLVACMKENGIRKFTFSSTWSGSVETAWLFQKNGCRLEGLVEINGRTKKIMENEYEKAHGYIFSI